MSPSHPTQTKQEDEYTKAVREMVPMFGDPGYSAGLKRIAEKFERRLRDVIKLALQMKQEADAAKVVEK